jgi:hypothetical protein
MQRTTIAIATVLLVSTAAATAFAQDSGPPINSAPTATTTPSGRDAKTVKPYSAQTQNPDINPNAAGTQYSGSSMAKQKERGSAGNPRGDSPR